MNSQQTPQSPPRAWTPYIVLASMLLLTAAATKYAATNARGKEQIRFEAAANRVAEIIESRMETYAATAAAGVGLYAASKSVELSEFHDFAAVLDIRRRYPGMQGLGFSARVRNKDALIQSMREQGVPDFKMWPEHDRPERHAVTSMEPPDTRNKATIGYDMSTEPALRAAMDRARDTGLPAASGRVVLATEPGRAPKPGLVLFVPVYRNNTPRGTEAERRSALDGFVYCPFYAEELFESMLTSGVDLDVDYELFDDPTLTPASRLYTSMLGGAPHEPPRLHHESSIDIAGHTWNLVFRPRVTARTSAVDAAPFVLAGGAIVSLLLFGLSRTQARANS